MEGPNIFPDNSRLGGANSRLGLLREFAPNDSIWLSSFVNKQRLSGKIDEIPVSTGKAGNLVRTRDDVPKAAARIERIAAKTRQFARRVR
jgi:hypothetical protein